MIRREMLESLRTLTTIEQTANLLESPDNEVKTKAHVCGYTLQYTSS